MVRLRLRCLALSGVAFFGAMPTMAQVRSPIPFVRANDGTAELGGWLEDRLQRMVNTCTGSRLVMKGVISTIPVSAIPGIVYDELRISDKPRVKISDGASVSYQFGTVYTGLDPLLTKVSTAIDGFDYANVGDRITSPGLNSVTYNNSCASVLNAAVKANGSYSLPVASLQAALQSDYEGSNSYALSLVSGTFASPLMRSLDNADPVIGERLYRPLEAALIVWNWYQANSDKIGSKNWVLKDFTGAAIYKWSGMKQQVKIGGSVSGSVTVPGFSGSASTSGSINTSLLINAESFEVAMRPLRRENFAPMISLPDLIAVAKNYGSFKLGEGSSTLELYNRDAKKLRYQTVQLPQQFCKLGLWGTDVQNIELLDVGFNKENGICTFDVQYSPASADSDVRLTPSFQRTIVAGGSTYVLKLTPAAVTLSARREPYLKFAGGLATPTFLPLGAVPPTSRLQWTFRYELSDNGLVADDSQISFSNVALGLSGKRHHPSSDRLFSLAAKIERWFQQNSHHGSHIRPISGIGTHRHSANRIC